MGNMFREVSWFKTLEKQWFDALILRELAKEFEKPEKEWLEAYIEIEEDGVVNIEPEYYLDQAAEWKNHFHANPNHGEIKGYSVMAINTPYFNKEMERWMASMILSDKPKYSRENLTYMIKRNPHIHNSIKVSLIRIMEERR